MLVASLGCLCHSARRTADKALKRSLQGLYYRRDGDVEGDEKERSRAQAPACCRVPAHGISEKRASTPHA